MKSKIEGILSGNIDLPNRQVDDSSYEE